MLYELLDANPTLSYAEEVKQKISLLKKVKKWLHNKMEM